MTEQAAPRPKLPRGLLIVRVLATILLVVMIVALIVKIDDVDPNTGLTKDEALDD